ncbi:DUF72 domain-containing protein [Alloacidobacterium dinghuense]|uniref:DUF72 domain-containing protein n=1 Tax=Alloacidobacterium dinghuense TaxID=2763107 RepID=A0A7G8BR33_9BACT|nr:DUF72 domain-containing protein [Alloacidobacterium dinghuense]
MNQKSQPVGIFVGCSGWAYPTWKPDFYPPKIPAKKFLEYYATQLNSVEVNYTFRSLPSANTTASWLAATGPDFRFSFKAPQRITHISRLKNCGAALTAFAESIRPIVDANRFGVVLFQLPPNFKADAAPLAAFLEEAASISLRMAFEFRHESWFVGEIYSILEKHGMALCVAESDELTTPDVRTADFACYRLRKSDYSTTELHSECDRLRKAARSGDVLAYFKHEDEPTGALRAAAVMKELRGI